MASRIPRGGRPCHTVRASFVRKDSRGKHPVSPPYGTSGANRLPLAPVEGDHDHLPEDAAPPLQPPARRVGALPPPPPAAALAGTGPGRGSPHSPRVRPLLLPLPRQSPREP